MPRPPPGTGVCAHDHECDEGDDDCSGSYAVYKTINMDRVRCLNEAVPNSCRGIFRSWETRLDVIDTPLRSECDDNDNDNDSSSSSSSSCSGRGDNELLLHVEFDASVNLKAFSVMGGLGDEVGRWPRSVRLYINRDDLDFEGVHAMEPVQSFDLVDNQAGTIEYPVRAAKFHGVHSIDMHFPSISESDRQSIYFVGFKGECESRRREAVDAVYEGVGLAKDHSVRDEARGVEGESMGYG